MSIKSLPGIAAWIGITYSLFSFLSNTKIGFFTPCDSFWVIAIPFASGLFLSLTRDKWLKPWLSLAMIMVAAGLIWLRIPFLIPVSLFLFTTGFNPLSRVTTDIRVAGLLFAIGLAWAQQILQWNIEVDAVILAAIGIFTFITKRIWPTPFSEIKGPSISINKLISAEKFIRALTNATLLLLLCALPLVNNNFSYSALITVIVVYFGVSFYMSKITTRFSVTTRYMTLFFSLFLLTLMTGFASRAHGLWIEIVFAISTICFTAIFYILQNKHQQKSNGVAGGETYVHDENWICLIALVFLAAHFPTCFYWIDRLMEVSLPEPFIPLALGQYFIKNLTLIPALATLMAGFLFLRRRSLE